MGLVQGGQVETIAMGGITLPSSRAFILTNVNGSGKYSTLLKNSSQYQVPAGKTLKIWAIKGNTSNTVIDGIASIGTATATCSEATSAPAGFNYLLTNFVPSCPNGNTQEFPYSATIASGLYPTMKNVTSGVCWVALLCTEE